ncbi:hypothetical protein MLD38_036111 [Melastoma candidum]|uniref:Uncharacterized protein n=1 Tax=Melastoma candidum TaxID=119954 RepID=A0ACB9LIQ5_9MYRT|nr:hypothetical protein MLD38_036111 [Melastoma candidum]
MAAAVVVLVVHDLEFYSNLYLFDSLKDTTVMKCGHTMHRECLKEMLRHNKYCCPICSRTVIDMSRTWKRLEEEVGRTWSHHPLFDWKSDLNLFYRQIEATVMPEEYRYKKVWILCNDCNYTTEVYFHIIGQKCSHCNSYNTRKISRPVIPQ